MDKQMLDQEELVEVLTGEQPVQRLVDWSDGDTVYGVRFFCNSYSGGAGKTYPKESIEGTGIERARERFEAGGMGDAEHLDSVLFTAIVRNPRTNARNVTDPGEPPGKFAELESVEILDRKPFGES